MAFKVPQSMDECLYFTNRDGMLAWVYRKDCPKCHKAKMGKPVVKGKVKIRAKEYVCPECNYTEEKTEHEDSLTFEATYTCPHCGKVGESTTKYKLKTFQGVPSYLLLCEHCGEKVPVTKKLKKPKEKKKKA